MRAFYFGAWGQAGHYLFLPDGHWDTSFASSPLGHHVDAQYAPRRHKYRRTLCWGRQGTTREERQDIGYDGEEYPQGQFLRHVVNGFTMISWWDRNQGDSRGGCNSNFMLEGEHTSEEMMTEFRKLFPVHAKNLDDVNIELVDVTPETT